MERKPRIRIINNQTVQIDDEDHTVMNPLKWCISNNFTGEKVELTGYTIPHPSDNVSNLTIQFCDEKVQKSENVLQKTAEALRCVEAIARKMISELEKSSDELR